MWAPLNRISINRGLLRKEYAKIFKRAGMVSLNKKEMEPLIKFLEFSEYNFNGQQMERSHNELELT